MLLDIGSGALGNLQLAIDYPALDAIVVSHMHADHFLDVIPLRYGLTYGPLSARWPHPAVAAARRSAEVEAALPRVFRRRELETS